MVKIMENPIKMDDLGGKPTIFGNIQIKNEGEHESHGVEVLLISSLYM